MKKVHVALMMAACTAMLGGPATIAGAQGLPACHDEVSRDDGTTPGDGCDEVGNPGEGVPPTDPRFWAKVQLDQEVGPPASGTDAGSAPQR